MEKIINDHESVETLETHPKVVPRRIENQFCVVMGFRVHCTHVRE